MNQRLRTACFTGVLTALTLAPISQATAVGFPFFGDKQQTPSLAPMLEQTMPAVVSIKVAGTQTSKQQIPEPLRRFFGAPQATERPFRSLGSGVIIDAKEGYIVTNAHVVAEADEIIVTLNDGREYSANKVGSDEQSDIALIQIEGEKLSEIQIANSDDLRVGDFVVAIGNPFGLSATVTSGIVSALGRTGINRGGLEDFIQTDAAINRGNSGGALINLNGELVGINAAIFSTDQNGGNVGIGFAIPSKMMQNLVNQMIEFGEVRRGLLGIAGNDVDAGLAEAFASTVSKGAFVAEVTPDSAASKADIQAGDIITRLDNDVIESFAELRAKVASMGAGAKVKLGIVRKGEEMDVTVVLGGAGTVSMTAAEIHPAFAGATFENGTDLAGNRGVEVIDIEPRSPAVQLGLKQNDVIIGVNRQRVNNVQELRERMEDSKDNVIALNIRRGNATLFVIIR